MESMTTRLPVTLVFVSGDVLAGEFLLSTVDGDQVQGHRLVLRFDGEEIAVADCEYFSALAAIRSALEPRGLAPRCYGASRNVYPSRLTRDWGGMRAYRMFLGRPGAVEDLVSIFDDGPDVDPVSVQVQEEFYLEWTRSLDPTRRVAAEAAAARPSRRFRWLPIFNTRKGLTVPDPGADVASAEAPR
ncbi:hypothetical protein VT85_14315 [Planctomyces sp. SH-PL62]|nr:hypothetical protein VT85_14315 [Planctomyces sp. SH-PL62]